MCHYHLHIDIFKNHYVCKMTSFHCFELILSYLPVQVMGVNVH
jgi:hypothetical protein